MFFQRPPFGLQALGDGSLALQDLELLCFSTHGNCRDLKLLACPHAAVLSPLGDILFLQCVLGRLEGNMGPFLSDSADKFFGLLLGSDTPGSFSASDLIMTTFLATMGNCISKHIFVQFLICTEKLVDYSDVRTKYYLQICLTCALF